MFNKIQDWFWTFISTRAVGVATKVVMAYLASQKVQELLTAAGVHIDPATLQNSLTVGIVWAIEKLHHLYDDYKAGKINIPQK